MNAAQIQVHMASTAPTWWITRNLDLELSTSPIFKELLYLLPYEMLLNNLPGYTAELPEH
jgi:hypothetical protein